MTQENSSDRSTRRKFLAATGAAGIVGLAGCAGGSGGSGGSDGSSSDGGDGMDTSLLKAEGSSTVYPIANRASSFWNSNPPASDQEYWPTKEYGYETEDNLADYWAGKYGFEATGEQATPPFRTTVGLSHSGTGIKAVMNGQVDIGDASAPAEAELDNPSQETLDKFVNHVVARDGQPIVVSKEIYDAGVTKLTGEQVKGIYQGEIENWSEVGGPDKEIYAVGRAEGSGTDTAFRLHLLGDANASMAGIDTRKGENQQAKTVVENSDNAICYIALAFVSEEAPAIALEFDGTTYELGGDPGLGAADYPLNRDLHMYTWEGTSKKESAFINFILSEMGQEMFVESNNYFPLPSSEIEKQRSLLADQV
ncbi:MAG: PstS family phosphate ABC transporter substrate-binding protein [Haloferacaceae archaeon]